MKFGNFSQLLCPTQEGNGICSSTVCKCYFVYPGVVLSVRVRQRKGDIWIVFRAHLLSNIRFGTVLLALQRKRNTVVEP